MGNSLQVGYSRPSGWAFVDVDGDGPAVYREMCGANLLGDGSLGHVRVFLLRAGWC